MAKKDNEKQVTAVQAELAVEAETAPAVKVKKAAPADPNKELVTIQLFKDGGRYKDDVDVAVNGKVFRIKRGEKVQVPAYVAEALEHSMKQDAATAAMMERESSEFKAEAKARNI